MKYLVTIFLVLNVLLFQWNIQSSHAQIPTTTPIPQITGSTPNFLNMTENVPGVGCGIPNDLNGKNRCCYITTMNTCTNPTITDFFNSGLMKGFVGNLPVVGGIINSFYNNCVEAEKNINTFQSSFSSACIYGEPSLPNDLKNTNCKCQSSNIATASAQISKMCYGYLSSTGLQNELKDCLDCSTHGKWYSGFGCIPLDIKSFITDILLSFGIGLGGVVALLCIIYSAFRMQTSGGNPEAIKKAQENLTSCILGLMLIIFAVFILRVIGVSILRIPFLK